MSRYQFIEQVATTEPVQVLCRVLAVSVAGYYQWRSRAARPTPAWEPAASAAFSRHAQRYGTRRLRAELRAEGHAVGRYALRNWLHRRGLRALSTPYDNAQAEAGWSTLKTELLPNGGVFTSLEEARLEVAHYLDTYFNLDRRHSALAYRSPHQFECDFLTTIS